MKKILLTTIALAVLAGALTFVHAGDMGNMSGMDMGGMQQTNAPMGSTNSDNSSLKSYPARGVVEKIAPDLSRVTIQHEDIPGYMQGMTMDFKVQNTNEFNGISPGNQITFTLVIGTNDEWIENVKPTGQTMPVMTNSMQSMDATNMSK